MLEQNEVCDISTVIPVAVLNEDFRPDQVRDGRDSHFVVEEFCRLRILEPVIGDGSNEVRRAENQVDVELPLEYFCDPPLVLDLGFVAERRELVQNFWIVA